MALPTKIPMHKAGVEAALNLVKASDMLPGDFEPGERFWDRLIEYVASKLPDGFDDLVGEEYFFQRFEENDGKVFCVVVHEETNEETPIEIEFIED